MITSKKEQILKEFTDKLMQIKHELIKLHFEIAIEDPLSEEVKESEFEIQNVNRVINRFTYFLQQ